MLLKVPFVVCNSESVPAGVVWVLGEPEMEVSPHVHEGSVGRQKGLSIACKEAQVFNSAQITRISSSYRNQSPIPFKFLRLY